MPIGLFGKCPGKRDFLSLNLPKGIMKLLEEWLQAAMAASQHELGPAWRDYYLIHPIWNFRIGSGVAGRDCMGALMPSMDGVGRYFPLCILAYSEIDCSDIPSMSEVDHRWFDLLHAQLLMALDEDVVADPGTLIEDLNDPEAHPATGENVEKIQKGYRLFLEEATGVNFARRLQEIDYLAGEATRSIWWTRGSQLVPAQVISLAGMPDPYTYLAMMGVSHSMVEPT